MEIRGDSASQITRGASWAPTRNSDYSRTDAGTANAWAHIARAEPAYIGIEHCRAEALPHIRSHWLTADLTGLRVGGQRASPRRKAARASSSVGYVWNTWLRRVISSSRASGPCTPTSITWPPRSTTFLYSRMREAIPMLDTYPRREQSITSLRVPLSMTRCRSVANTEDTCESRSPSAVRISTSLSVSS